VEWKKVNRNGAIAEEILSVAHEESADIIMMATEGHHGVLDALRGSVTEQVLHQANCPLFAVPSN